MFCSIRSENSVSKNLFLIRIPDKCKVRKDKDISEIIKRKDKRIRTNKKALILSTYSYLELNNLLFAILFDSKNNKI